MSSAPPNVSVREPSVVRSKVMRSSSVLPWMRVTKSGTGPVLSRSALTSPRIVLTVPWPVSLCSPGVRPESRWIVIDVAGQDLAAGIGDEVVADVQLDERRRLDAGDRGT